MLDRKLNEVERRLIREKRRKKRKEESNSSLGKFMKYLILGKIIECPPDFPLELLEDFYKISRDLNPFYMSTIYGTFEGPQGVACDGYFDVPFGTNYSRVEISEDFKTLTKVFARKEENITINIPQTSIPILEDIYYNQILPIYNQDIDEEKLTEEEEKFIEARRFDLKIKNDLKKQKSSGDSVKEAIEIIREYGKRIN